VDLEKVNPSTLRWMPGAVSLISFDGQPAPVPDLLIAAIERQVQFINASQKQFMDDLKPGDPVLVQDGPFAGYEAIFDGRISGRDRVRVLLNLLQKRQVPLDLREQQIGRVKRS
jgi:transcriptional antiterminator RfaH